MIMPFGKYSGMPIPDMVRRDPKYSQWMILQPDFRKNFPHICALIKNYLDEISAKTPEHNRKQLRFQDRLFQIAIASLALAKSPEQFVQHGISLFEEIKNRRINNIFRIAQQQRFESFAEAYPYTFEYLSQIYDILEYQLDWDSTHTINCAGDVRVEVFCRAKENHDFNCQIFEGNFEIKPTIGDEYPAVIQQMLRDGIKLVLVTKYIGEPIFEQFIRAFENEKLGVIFEHEVDKRMIQCANLSAAFASWTGKHLFRRAAGGFESLNDEL